MFVLFRRLVTSVHYFARARQILFSVSISFVYHRFQQLFVNNKSSAKQFAHVIISEVVWEADTGARRVKGQDFHVCIVRANFFSLGASSSFVDESAFNALDG